MMPHFTEEPEAGQDEDRPARSRAWIYVVGGVVLATVVLLIVLAATGHFMAR